MLRTGKCSQMKKCSPRRKCSRGGSAPGWEVPRNKQIPSGLEYLKAKQAMEAGGSVLEQNGEAPGSCRGHISEQAC